MSARSHDLLHHGSGALMVAAARAVAGIYRPLLQPLGLTHPQYLVLLALDLDDPQSCAQLSDTLHLTSATMSPLLKRLEALGHVNRDRSTISERELEISLTTSGRELLPALWDIGEEVQRTVTTEPATRDELQTLVHSALAGDAPTA